MVNYIWVGMLLIGFLFAIVNGTIDEVNAALFKAAADAVTICFGLMSVLVFWLGLMKIAEDSGLLEKLAKLFLPIVTRLFPDIPKNHPAIGYIMSNMIANTFGLGNAATPLGIKAMEQLKEYYDAEFEQAVVKSVLTSKVMRLIRDAADVTVI